MAWEQTVQTKQAAREDALNIALHALSPDVGHAFSFEALDRQTLISKLAAGEMTAEFLTARAIRK